MKVQVWNAFASNNSGSYTLVGYFSDKTLAADVAAELARVAAEHDAWMVERRDKGWGDAPPSPLEVFMQRHALTPASVADPESDWPEYSENTTPAVWAQGHQVFIHHGQTVGLPPVFAEYFYKRGGRVETELEHSHHPLVGVFSLQLSYGKRAGYDIPAQALRLLGALYAEDGPLAQLTMPEPPPAWRVGERSGEADLTVGVVFTDVVEGFTAVSRIAAEHGFEVYVKVFEAWDRKGDALTFLRPCRPPQPPTRELFDVIITDPAPAALTAVIGMIEELRQVEPHQARALLESAPVAVRRQLPRGVAEAMVSRLQRAGARAELRPTGA